MSPPSTCCGFCQKPPDQDGDISKWKKVNDTSSLQAFWCDLSTLRGSNDKSFVNHKSCKLCGECNTLWKQWLRAYQTFKSVQMKKKALLGRLSKVIPSANSCGAFEVKQEPMSEVEDEDLFLPSEYSQPQINLGTMLDVMMKSDDGDGTSENDLEKKLEDDSMDAGYSPINPDDDGDDNEEDDDEDIEQALKDEALGDNASEDGDSEEYEEDEDGNEDSEGSSCEDNKVERKKSPKKKSSEEDANQKDQPGSGKKRLFCEFCGTSSKRFWSIATLVCHLEQKHSKKAKIHCCTFPSCNEKFATSVQLDEHFRNHLRDSVKVHQLSCRFCSMTFSSQERRENHEAFQHKNSADGSQSTKSPRKRKDKFVCSTCGKLYPSFNSLKHHERTGHGRLVYCEICPPDKNYRSHERLLFHILNIHENDPAKKFIQCPRCPTRFATKFMMKRHFEGHMLEAEKPLSCPVCEKRFATTEEEALATHVKSHETGYERSQLKYKCSKCPREFAAVQKTQLYRHERKHHPELLIYACHKCDRRYSVEVFLETHLKIHDEKGPYVCLVCCSRFGSRLVQGGYPFETGELLDVHFKKHTGENYKICEVCGNKFETQNILLHHMSKAHGAERKFACNLCEKRYPTPSDLTAHIRWSHEQRWRQQAPMKCPECDLVFYNKPSLRNHVRRVHRQAERKICEQCGKTLRSGVALRDHMNMHEGVKNFACDWCEKRFVRKDELVMHTYTHTGEKPHKCYICQKGFTQRHSMKTHMKVHERNGTWIPKPPDVS